MRRGVLLSPLGVEGLERVPGRLGRLRAVDLAEPGGHRLAVLPGAEVERVADEMNDAGLHDRLGEGRVDRFGKTLQTVDDRDQDVLDAAVPELVHHREPELRALVLGDPQAQDLAGALAGDAEREIDRLVLHDPAVLVADLHPRAASKITTG
jgi:hypothetical protein